MPPSDQLPSRHRWDGQAAAGEPVGGQARLPGYRDAVPVRRFDAPEALDIRFYEVAAKSALNRVPAASRMPFRWTVNPYRGCTHACVYCAAGDTPVLMGDGSQRPLAELRPGDEVYGSARFGVHRRYVRTTVLDHWETVRSAWRVVLDDGTELVTSGDHRFLSRRGFRHVAGALAGQGRRPHLEVGDVLAGSGRVAAHPAGGADYRRGYVCGLLRADARYAAAVQAARPAAQPAGTRGLARNGLEELALARAQAYVLGEVAATRVAGAAAVGAGGSASRTVRSTAWPQFAWVSLLTRWPVSAGREWSRGFVAGVFDAAGSRSPYALRIASDQCDIVRLAGECLARLGFDVECDRGRDCRAALRLRGGLREQLRFFALTDPASVSKRDIAGDPVKSTPQLRVVAIERLRVRMPMYDITTGSGDFVADGVISHNCFARPTHTYLNFDAGRDFEREIVVKVNAPEVLRAELARPSWRHEHVAMGTNTDPYQWVESRYRLMPGIWEALRDSRTPCSVLTKSPLVLRDLGLLQDVARHTEVTAALSIPTLDTRAWRATEPHTPHPQARIEAVAELNRAGIPTGVLIAPLMPGINDAPEQLQPLLEKVTEAGATHIGTIALHLRGEVKPLFMQWLADNRRDLVPRYQELYGRGAYAPPAERERLAALAGARRYDRAPASLRGASSVRARGSPLKESPPSPPAPQGTLF